MTFKVGVVNKATCNKPSEIEKKKKSNKTQTKFLGIETTEEKYIKWNKNKLGISEERIHRLGDIAIKTTQKDTRRGKKRQKILNRASLS